MASPLTSELIEAAKDGNQERCQQLLIQGADVNGANEVGSEDICFDLAIILIIPSSSLHLLIYYVCCVSLDPLPFTLRQGMVMLILSASF